MNARAIIASAIVAVAGASCCAQPTSAPTTTEPTDPVEVSIPEPVQQWHDSGHRCDDGTIVYVSADGQFVKLRGDVVPSPNGYGDVIALCGDDLEA